MISANGGLPAHRYTPQVTQGWSRGSEPASPLFSERCEAGSDPRGHLWVTWGVYLWAGKPPLARTPVAIFWSLGVCIYGPASRHWLISYSPIHLTPPDVIV